MATPGISFGGVPVIRFSMLADVADVLQLKAAGKKDEGPMPGRNPVGQATEN